MSFQSQQKGDFSLFFRFENVIGLLKLHTRSLFFKTSTALRYCLQTDTNIYTHQGDKWINCLVDKMSIPVSQSSR